MVDKSKYLVLDIESTGIDIIKDDILSLSIFDPKNEVFFETFLSKHLHGNDFCYTFASAFENELIELTTR